MSFAAYRARQAAGQAAAGAADPGPTCATCLAFHADDAARQTGECRRHAPRPSVADGFAWPKIDGDDWCVQHRQSVAPFNLTFVESAAPVDPKGSDDD